MEKDDKKAQLRVSALDSFAALSEQPRHSIGRANWEAFPAGPSTTFRIGRVGDAICILYEVEEGSPRTVNVADGTPVYQDSCVEFFCKVPGSSRYFNFEFNSAGACRAASRIERSVDVRPLSDSELAGIERQHGSDGARWGLLVSIPLRLIAGEGPMPAELQANFYKCGDLTARPHYLSWAPIDAPKPDFHRPECFGRLLID